METKWNEKAGEFQTLTNHEWAGCREGSNCTGPGCHLTTGKTRQDRSDSLNGRPRVIAHRERLARSKTAKNAESGTFLDSLGAVNDADGFYRDWSVA